jgi:hypothetical protein
MDAGGQRAVTREGSPKSSTPKRRRNTHLDDHQDGQRCAGSWAPVFIASSRRLFLLWPIGPAPQQALGARRRTESMKAG